MLYELKQYLAHPGQAEALRERFMQVTLPIFKRLGIKVIAIYAPLDRPEELHYITAFADQAQRQAAWAAFAEDPQWRNAKAASERQGPLLASQTAEVMQALSIT
ncbi:NIPSNAP [Bordetella trematum]|uniref:NIPSNAP family protein n=1 Tax=Bordetella trematum TaxID=123899 RepID=UPI0007919E44|nr:NIPSNAP family protein [Bordetella trematum]SAI60976.1 NIPSNAP [Bordetella trematum]SPU49543.1 NIPSNAP [Bordetella trematum]VDH05398.1 NIPSNAP [Bordetella trematum]